MYLLFIIVRVCGIYVEPVCAGGVFSFGGPGRAGGKVHQIEQPIPVFRYFGISVFRYFGITVFRCFFEKGKRGFGDGFSGRPRTPFFIGSSGFVVETSCGCYLRILRTMTAPLLSVVFSMTSPRVAAPALRPSMVKNSVRTAVSSSPTLLMADGSAVSSFWLSLP